MKVHHYAIGFFVIVAALVSWSYIANWQAQRKADKASNVNK